jgi:ketosteroid isomerase-like protein
MQRFHGIGKASGVETEGRNALLITMRDGKIVRMEGFWDIAAALRAAGIDVDHL